MSSRRAKPRSAGARALDSQARAEKDPTARMRLFFTLDMLENDAPKEYIARQFELVEGTWRP